MNQKNKTIAEARSILKSSGFNINVTGDEDENTTLIVDQMPKAGVTLLENSTSSCLRLVVFSLSS